MAVADVERDLRDTIKDQLAWDDRVKITDVEVEVDDGKVILRGKVPTYFSRVAAEEDAWSVIGVTDVQNELKVTHKEEFNLPKDAEIEEALDNMIRLDLRIDSEIIVEVNSGVVTLNGTVNAFWKKNVVEQYVHRIVGVVDVINKIRIVPRANLGDNAIRKDIERALRRNSVTKDSNITVQVEAGQVTLSGVALSNIERNTAEDLANFTSGVTHVQNEMKLSYNNPRTVL